MIMRTKENISIKDLSREIASLRSFVIGIAGKDNEGEYRPEFVKKVLTASQKKTVGNFTTADGFLTEVNRTL